MSDMSKCPVLHNIDAHKVSGTTANQHWWPHQISLKLLSQQGPATDPMGEEFDYAEEFKSLDLDAVVADLKALMTDSQDWWPADFGHYGPFFIRMAWHSAGTYRIGDGRGGSTSGTMRFAPLNGWPDNVNLDKARRLLWPIKQKYGRKLSWADLMILTGNVALEDMGLPVVGFAGGRADVYEPEEDIYWGPETVWLEDERYEGERELIGVLGAVQMGLIYVNPEGPNGNHDPMGSAHDIRETFGRMAMNDEETVALIAGGHTFGKGHGAADPGQYSGPDPEGSDLQEQGLGWKSSFNSGSGVDAIGSGMEGTWSMTPTTWDNNYFDNLLGFEWEKTTTPAGTTVWQPTDKAAHDTVPDAHDPNKRNPPSMYTSDIALITDPAYKKISQRFHENFDEFTEAFAKAWFKLTHRDMGPVSAYLGKLVPSTEELWQDPIPAPTGKALSKSDIASLKSDLLGSGLSNAQLVKTAWAAAASYRTSDRRGGANGARLALAPQKDWTVNEPKEVAKVLSKLEDIKSKSKSNVSLADLIVLGGCAAIEDAAKQAGINLNVPFSPGRTDTTQELTDVESFAVLEPRADGFRNYCKPGAQRAVEDLLVDKAQLLGLTAPELTVLVGGLRTLEANHGNSKHGVLTATPGKLTNDFFKNLLTIENEWVDVSGKGELFEGRSRDSGKVNWTATRADLIFGSDSRLRAICEVYGADDASEKFANDFAAAWHKVMNGDRFDLEAKGIAQSYCDKLE